MTELNNSIFNKMREYAMQNNIPIIRTQTALHIFRWCKDNQPKNILEIGTAIGYSASVILSACKDAHLTTLDIDSIRQTVAENYLREQNLSAEIVCTDALKYLQDCKHQFDLVFLDGPKGQYIKYLPYIKQHLDVGGTLIADDILYHGLVKQEGIIQHKHRTIVNNLRMFIKDLNADKNFECQVLEIEDGIMIAKKVNYK